MLTGCSLLCRLAVRNGSITTVMTIITIIVFKSQPEDNTAVMIEMTIGRIYTISMLSNLNNRILMTGDSSDRSSPKRTAGVDTHGNPSTVVRIRQDIETHYQSDADAIPRGQTAYGTRKGDLESGDGASDREVGLVVHIARVLDDAVDINIVGSVDYAWVGYDTSF
ncbi:hypothetical protein B0H14DRAFT_3698947 [Mycena olivaceomarginata]|nr:hypothetical protein B0H14DRAFT_3698947 [Mycena olivaceomarginata]